MITLACVACRLALRAMGDITEMDYLIGERCEWFPDRYPCPRSGCGARMTLTDVLGSEDLASLEVRDLNPQEVFQALQGMGLPEERQCDVAATREALRGQRIISIDMQGLPDTSRTLVYSLLLDSGYRIYLGASPLGVVVYRIAPPRSVTTEVLDATDG